MEPLRVAVVLLGIACGWLLFAFVRRLPRERKAAPDLRTLSIIIPCRNEAARLPLLLADLASQNVPIHEILCVNDQSEDTTQEVIHAYGATHVPVLEKPAGWQGKTYACQLGAERATGDLLLFLDADVRLSSEGLSMILSQYAAGPGQVLSVQPWHIAKRAYEQFSLFFNLVLAAAYSELPFVRRTPGLYGPIICIAAETYRAVGGHGAVKGAVVEDMQLGEKLHQQGIPYQRCVGRPGVSFRMYAEGPRQLIEGWTKNFSTGAMHTALPQLLCIILWMVALCSVPIALCKALFSPDHAGLLLPALLYVCNVAQLFVASRVVGRFHPLALLLYPICLVGFIALFINSFIRKIFRLPVRWRGREVA